jgi:hypothetical protein
MRRAKHRGKDKSIAGGGGGRRERNKIDEKIFLL